jgi:hypothetical protein
MTPKSQPEDGPQENETVAAPLSSSSLLEICTGQLKTCQRGRFCPSVCQGEIKYKVFYKCRRLATVGAALENSPHVIKKTPSLFHVCKKKKEKKGELATPEVKKGKLATPEVKPEPPPSPISSQRHHIDCGDNFAMLVPKVADLAT